MESSPTIDNVKQFWATEACGTHFVQEAADDREFFAKYCAYRYATEWHIRDIVPFAEMCGKDVLEIGTGNGADGVLIAQNAARYTGVDLTDAALDATRRHFEVADVRGTFIPANAERLPFSTGSFDFVYSHGVLHHSPNPQRAIDEVHRVLRPGGKAIVMLYHRHSFNYYIRIMGYMRTRVLLHKLMRDPRTEASGIRGNTNPLVWDIHARNIEEQGWRYLRARNFVHHATDGPECPFAFTFTKAEVREMFSRFVSVTTRVAHFPLRKYSGAIPFWLEKAAARTVGWYLFVSAEKTQGSV